MANVDIVDITDTARLIAGSEAMKANVEEMYGQLQDISAQMKNLNSYYNNIAAEALRGKYNETAAKFDALRDSMKEYSQFVNNYARGHEAQTNKQREIAEEL